MNAARADVCSALLKHRLRHGPGSRERSSSTSGDPSGACSSTRFHQLTGSGVEYLAVDQPGEVTGPSSGGVVLVDRRDRGSRSSSAQPADRGETNILTEGTGRGRPAPQLEQARQAHSEVSRVRVFESDSR